MKEANSDAFDNVVWHALTGPNRHLGRSLEHAARFDPDVSPFAAICDDACPQGWADLATLIGSGRRAILFRTPPPLPDGWAIEHTIPCVQMIAEHLHGTPDDRFVALGPHDVPDMLALVNETQPGPFGTRTIEFGGYIGLRADGRLVAMAGERLRIEGYAEVSAVCTSESHRGRGLASALVNAVVHGVRARGEVAFLHAASSNETAIRVYRALGFTLRSEPEAFVLRVPE
jgi:ribosomal protein S18 acetylase RimI-like enzyme